jgi:hypothetical protein
MPIFSAISVGVIDLDAEVTNRTPNLRMTEQELDCA